MKNRIKRALKKIPIAYEVSRFFYGQYTSRFVFSKDRERGRKNLDAFRSMSNLLKELHLTKAEFDERGIVLQLRDGTKFVLNPETTNPLLTIPLNGYFEDNETAFLQKKIKESWTVLDIGANFGWYSVQFSKMVGAGGQVHSFEPVPEAFSELEQNVKLNGCGKNVFLNNSAAGKNDGRIDLYVPEELGTAFTSEHNHGKKVEAELVKIDTYVAKKGIQRIDLIKADVEGGEMNVLLGAKKTIEAHHPDLFLEVYEDYTAKFGYKPANLFNLLVDMGYSIFNLERSGELKKLEDFEVLPSYNFYCTIRYDVGQIFKP